MYEVRWGLDLSAGVIFGTAAALGMINSLLLRRYVVIIRPQKTGGDPRWATHFIICFFSLTFILWGNDVEHDARAKMFHAKSFAGLTFEEAEYLYIDNPSSIDTARYGQDIKFDSFSHNRGFSRDHVFTGYYVAPFIGYDSVFFALEHRFERSVSTLPLPQKNSHHKTWTEFSKEFNELESDIIPNFSGHLFQRLRPEDDSNYWVALGYSYMKDSICHPMNEIHESVILTPVKDDRMPRWTDRMPIILGFFLPFYFLWFIFIFGTSKTTGNSTGSKPRKSKRR